MAHIRKSIAESVVVRPNQGIVAKQIDVIFDDHDVPLRILGVHAAARVADDERIATEGLHDANGNRDRLKRLAVIKVKTAFHGNDAFAAERSAYQPTSVGLNGGRREMRNLVIR